MRIIGCDLHARQQTLAMLNTETGEMVNLTLIHEGNQVREFYSELAHPVLVASKPPDRCSGFYTIAVGSFECLAASSTATIPPEL
jgi:hypothetical protein